MRFKAALLTLLLSGGCSCTSVPPENVEEAPQPLEIKRVEAANLPELAVYLPPVDQGRVEINPPSGWIIRDQNTGAYLYDFAKVKSERMPAIIVRAASSPYEDFENVTEENVLDFAKAVQEQTLNKLKEPPLEDALPMMLGSNAFVRYVRKARVKNVAAEDQVLVTVHNGRMYTVELQVRPEMLLTYRDNAYAVAAGMKFHDK